jgi:hypothetical protein
MTRPFHLFSCLFLFSGALFAQSETQFFPQSLVVEPFYANFLEPKIGFLFTTGDNNIRLDIGASRDFIHYQPSPQTTIGFGADFFTYTKLRGEANFRFPVEAVDYLFGVNGSFLKTGQNSAYGARFRYAHISAHFVDGHYDSLNGTWLDGRTPHVYSREFLELTPFYQTDHYRVYAGGTYMLHVIPSTIKKLIVNGGFEYFLRLGSGKVNPFAAYDLRSITLDKMSINNTVMAGIKFGDPYSAGFRIQYVYYNGYDIHGEYYNVRETTSSIGFTIDF